MSKVVITIRNKPAPILFQDVPLGSWFLDGEGDLGYKRTMNDIDMGEKNGMCIRNGSIIPWQYSPQEKVGRILAHVKIEVE